MPRTATDVTKNREGVADRAEVVGGDFFQYSPLVGDRLAISMADVTGHAMEAAIPVVCEAPGPTFVRLDVDGGTEGPISRSASEESRYLQVSLEAEQFGELFEHPDIGLYA